MKKYVQYGCGFSAPLEWKNYDSSPTLRFEKLPIIGKLKLKNAQKFPRNVFYGDIVNGLPEIENSIDGIYCSHVLEHLSYEDFLQAIKNTYKILKSGGIFRCVVPDLKHAAEEYLKNFERDSNPAQNFMTSTMLGVENRNKSIFGTLVSLFGNSKHLWMWDDKSLTQELDKVGFINCRNCSFNDSSDIHFKYVEEQSRFLNAVAIECYK